MLHVSATGINLNFGNFLRRNVPQSYNYKSVLVVLMRVFPSQNAAVRSYGDNPLVVWTYFHPCDPPSVAFANMSLLAFVVLPHLQIKVKNRSRVIKKVR